MSWAFKTALTRAIERLWPAGIKLIKDGRSRIWRARMCSEGLAAVISIKLPGMRSLRGRPSRSWATRNSGGYGGRI